MSFTNTRLYRTVWGNKIVEAWDVTTDAASGSISTGMSVIEAIIGVVPVSAATAAPKFKMNTSAASATANGVIFVSSAASADHFIVVAAGH